MRESEFQRRGDWLHRKDDHLPPLSFSETRPVLKIPDDAELQEA
jgi:hypothetical protein